MDSPNANTNTMTGIQASIAPNAVKPSTLDRFPSWKIHTSAPNTAPRDSVFMTRALIGMTTDPVIRNSRAKVASAIADGDGIIGDIVTVSLAREHSVRDITLEVRDTVQAERIAELLGRGRATMTADATRVFPLIQVYRYPIVAALVGSWMEGGRPDGTVLYGD